MCTFTAPSVTKSIAANVSKRASSRFHMSVQLAEIMYVTSAPQGVKYVIIVIAKLASIAMNATNWIVDIGAHKVGL